MEFKYSIYTFDLPNQHEKGLVLGTGEVFNNSIYTYWSFKCELNDKHIVRLLQISCSIFNNIEEFRRKETIVSFKTYLIRKVFKGIYNNESIILKRITNYEIEFL